MGGGGLRYAYDDADKLTLITDYDNSVLSYTYDAASYVVTMNDYHSNVTAYSYSDTNQLSTITAPGSKVWTYQYNAIGQPTEYEHPNGMDTVYSYDGRNRLTKIEHKDGVTVKDSFTYVLDDVGNVESVEQVDGSVWDYWYDGRYRLTKAVRDNAQTSPTITATYEYTYDDGDNMVTKEHPFEDRFDDGNYTGWSTAETWSASTGVMDNTSSTGIPRFWKTATDDDYDLRFSYLLEDDSDTTFYVAVNLRDASGDISQLRILPDQMLIREYISSSWSTLVSDTNADTVEDTWYDVRILVDGDDVTVWRGQQGGSMDEVLSSTNLGVTGITLYRWQVFNEAEFQFDNIQIITDDFDSTTAYAYNNANELTKLTQPDGSQVDFEYDLWGRMTKKELGTTYEATYGYRYGGFLLDVNTDWPGEQDVDYDYGADRKRRERTSGGTTVKYNWDQGFSVVSLENSSGTLTDTFIYGFATVSGSSPATGTWNYYTQDRLGSVRSVFDGDVAKLISQEFLPYGNALSRTGGDVEFGFAGKPWDAAAGLHYFKYRYLMSGTGTWSRRDPSQTVDGPNMYRYALNDPVNNIDPFGLEVQVCTRPVQGMDFLPPWLSPNHAYIKIPDAVFPNAKEGGNQDTAGFGGSPAEVHTPDLDPDPEKIEAVKLPTQMNTGELPNGTPCKKATEKQIEQCIIDTVTEMQNDDPEYNLGSYNCKHWVNTVLNKCCLNSVKFGPGTN